MRSGETFEVRNPADAREVVAEVPAMDAADAERALARAREAQPGWGQTSIVVRGEILRRAAAAILREGDEIARDVTREMGKLIAESRTEVAKAAELFEYYASFGRRLVGELLPGARSGAEARTVREPRGVVVAIAPWSDPDLTVSRKLGPALASGNAVVLKPAPESPLSALHVARALPGGGTARGVLEVVTGPDDDVSRRLVTTDGFDALTFTGSTETGHQIRRQLAGRNIPLQTEMAGRTPPSCSPTRTSTSSSTRSARGVRAGGHVLVEPPVYVALVERLSARTRDIRLGPGLDESSGMRPLVDESRLESVLGSLDEACADEAELIAGGGRPGDARLGHGWFLQPDPPPCRDRIERGVAGRAVRAGRRADAGRLARARDRARQRLALRALSASIFTRDLEAEHRFATQADVGCVAIDLPTAG